MRRDKMATMTFNMTEREMEVLAEMAKAKELSKTALLKQALRLYQMVDKHLADGERMMFSGDGKRAKEFIGL